MLLKLLILYGDGMYGLAAFSISFALGYSNLPSVRNRAKNRAETDEPHPRVPQCSPNLIPLEVCVLRS
jgi:hypothetical protein